MTRRSPVVLSLLVGAVRANISPRSKVAWRVAGPGLGDKSKTMASSVVEGSPTFYLFRSSSRCRGFACRSFALGHRQAGGFLHDGSSVETASGEMNHGSTPGNRTMIREYSGGTAVRLANAHGEPSMTGEDAAETEPDEANTEEEADAGGEREVEAEEDARGSGS